MGDFHDGRAAGVFIVGRQLDNAKEVHELELLKALSRASGMASVVLRLREFKGVVAQKGAQGEVPLKEAERSCGAVQSCIDIIVSMKLEEDAQALSLTGSVKALEAAIAAAKRSYEDENKKAREVAAFEGDPEAHISERPIGFVPSKTEAVSRGGRSKKKKVSIPPNTET